MKRICAFAAVAAVLMTASFSEAARLRLTVPEPVGLQAPLATPDPVSAAPTEYEYVVATHPVELYTNVKYRQTRKIHPCAEPKIVQVPNPCYDPCDPCCGPKCVFVKICVPPCDCPDVTVRRCGDKIRYDYGKYAVNVIVRRSSVLVDYDW